MDTTITPMTQLPDGTPVRILTGHKGVVVSSTVEKDQFNKPIVVHVIRRTHERCGNRWHALKTPWEEDCNYSFIVPETGGKYGLVCREQPEPN